MYRELEPNRVLRRVEMTQYQVCQLSRDAWFVYDNFKMAWVNADFNSEGAALAYISSRHPGKEISTGKSPEAIACSVDRCGDD